MQADAAVTPIRSPVFLTSLGAVIRRLDKRARTWADQPCPNCRELMTLWRAEAELPMGIVEAEGETYDVVLAVGGVPAIHCGCDLEGEVHLFAKLDGTDSDDQVIRSMARRELPKGARLGRLTLRDAHPGILVGA